MNDISQLIFYSLIGGLFSLLGGIAILWRADLIKRFMLPLLCFAAGAFMGASFLDILPEAVEMVDEPHPVFIAALVGFILFFILERVFMRYFRESHDHSHSHADHTESLPLLLIIGDSIHNFLDGVVIALAFLANPALGLATTLAVAAHEIPQEIGDFSILVNQGWEKWKIIAVNIGQSLLSVVGALIGYWLGQTVEGYLPYLLAAAGGIFLYIAASDIIPEIHHAAGHKYLYRVITFFILGIAAVGYLTSLAHGA